MKVREPAPFVKDDKYMPFGPPPFDEQDCKRIGNHPITEEHDYGEGSDYEETGTKTEYTCGRFTDVGADRSCVGCKDSWDIDSCKNCRYAAYDREVREVVYHLIMKHFFENPWAEDNMLEVTVPGHPDWCTKDNTGRYTINNTGTNCFKIERPEPNNIMILKITDTEIAYREKHNVTWDDATIAFAKTLRCKNPWMSKYYGKIRFATDFYLRFQYFRTQESYRDAAELLITEYVTRHKGAKDLAGAELAVKVLNYFEPEINKTYNEMIAKYEHTFTFPKGLKYTFYRRRRGE